MKIAIHHNKGSFSERWIDYCENKGINYKLVNCYRSDIIRQLSDCDALMWHFNHKGPKESKFAKQLLYSFMASGKKVFPDFNTVWHFDDKVGQKYLLEAIGAPLANSYVFYSKQEALNWVKQTGFPKVFKLRNGAGSDNVRIVKSQASATNLIKKSFNKGFSQYDSWKSLAERYRKYRIGKGTIWNLAKGIIRLVHKTEFARLTGREKGYIYFQDFIPGNDYDIRVIVIGNKAFAIKRIVRKNDFRASGSGLILYDKEHINIESVRLAFEISMKLKDQCMAYDFVFLDGKPIIIEISYGFAIEGYDSCVGYWDRNMTWHEGSFNPYGWMIENLINSLKQRALIEE